VHAGPKDYFVVVVVVVICGSIYDVVHEFSHMVYTHPERLYKKSDTSKK
jgi:hypothetical protein